MRDTDQHALDLFADYQRSKNLAQSTIRNRRSILTGLAARSGTLVDCDIFTIRRHLGREQISAATRRTERGAIVAFFAFLADEGLRDDNPGARLPLVRVPKGKPRPFTAQQIDAMLLSGAYRRTRAMILVGCYQGFRVSQIAAVHGHDIDLASGTIRTIGKGGKLGILPLHPMIAELARHMPPDDWWFPARRGVAGHIAGSGVTDLVRRARVRAGILDPKLTAHSLRHSFGTDLVEAGVDIRVVKELMMHEDLSTTQIYTDVSDRLKRAGITALAARELPAQSGRRAA